MFQQYYIDKARPSDSHYSSRMPYYLLTSLTLGYNSNIILHHHHCSCHHLIINCYYSSRYARVVVSTASKQQHKCTTGGGTTTASSTIGSCCCCCWRSIGCYQDDYGLHNNQPIMFFTAFYITVMRLDRRPQGGGRGAAIILLATNGSDAAFILDGAGPKWSLFNDGAAFYISVIIARASGSEAELCLYC